MIILTYDVGTTGVKTCLYAFHGNTSAPVSPSPEDRPQDSPFQEPFVLLDSSYASYHLRSTLGGANRIRRMVAAYCHTTRVHLPATGNGRIAGISF